MCGCFGCLSAWLKKPKSGKRVYRVNKTCVKSSSSSYVRFQDEERVEVVNNAAAKEEEEDSGLWLESGEQNPDYGGFYNIPLDDGPSPKSTPNYRKRSSAPPPPANTPNCESENHRSEEERRERIRSGMDRLKFVLAASEKKKNDDEKNPFGPPPNSPVCRMKSMKDEEKRRADIGRGLNKLSFILRFEEQRDDSQEEILWI